MRLSERGAIRSAIAEGGFHIYPAGKLVELIKSALPGDELKGDFDPAATVAKIEGIALPADPAAHEVFCRDRETLCSRLKVMNPEYDIDAVFDRLATSFPILAKRYYGLTEFEAPRPNVVEYYFEGHNELYKDGDWYAFNVNTFESKELGVPYGTYFKRDQISPGHPEYVAMHEVNHVMQEKVGLYSGFHHYIPWMEEGFADILGKMMLMRATDDESLLKKIKGFRTEIDAQDPRKVAYHYGEETAALILLRGRLPFFKTMLKVRGDNAFSVDWNSFARQIKGGADPHVALVSAYTGGKRDAFQKRTENIEAAFRKEGDLDQMDLKMIQLFLATTEPACIPAPDYKAALWLDDQVSLHPSPHFVDPSVVPQAVQASAKDWSAGTPFPIAKIPNEAWKKHPELMIKTVILESQVPTELLPSVQKLSSMYYIIKREIGGTAVFEPYGGGLPYRLATGEVRCTY